MKRSGKIYTALRTTADSTLGYKKRCNLNWFGESLDELEPLLHKSYPRWLTSGHSSDKLWFLNARREACQAVTLGSRTR